MVQGGGFEPPKLSRQIYSLIPLATREPLRKSDAFSAHTPQLSTTSDSKILKKGQKSGVLQKLQCVKILKLI